MFINIKGKACVKYALMRCEVLDGNSLFMLSKNCLIYPTRVWLMMMEQDKISVTGNSYMNKCSYGREHHGTAIHHMPYSQIFRIVDIA